MKKQTVFAFLVVLALALSSCGTTPPATLVTVSPTPTATQPPTDIPTQTLMPTVTLAPPTSWTESVITPTPRTPSGEIKFPTPRIYTENGNLYFQDNTGKPTQLNNSGKVYSAILSDDGQKVVFYLQDDPNKLYSINSNRSNEQVIITNNALPSLQQGGKIKALTFIPKTHFLLFNIYLCDPNTLTVSQKALDCTVDIYKIDTDSKRLLSIVTGLHGNSAHEHNFEVSPNGKYISVAAAGHINIYTDSDIVYQNVITYEVTSPNEYLPKQYWFPDSSGLIFVVAISPLTWTFSQYIAYRYKLGEEANLVPFDKFIVIKDYIDDEWCVSPDRNWILFPRHETGEPFYSGNHYVGNLNNGHTRAYEASARNSLLYSCLWSPDSKYFIDSWRSTIESVDGSQFIPVDGYLGYFLAWIDNTHYYYLADDIPNTPSTRQTYIGEIPNK